MNRERQVDAGSFLLGERLCAIEAKLDVIVHAVRGLTQVGAAMNARLERVAQALDIGREADTLTLYAEAPTQETRCGVDRVSNVVIRTGRDQASSSRVRSRMKAPPAKGYTRPYQQRQRRYLKRNRKRVNHATR